MSSNYEPTKSTNFLLRLFRGDVSLPITYWLFGVIGNIPFHVAFTVYEYNYAGIVTAGSIGLQVGILLLSSIAISYCAFISIAIWRSAGKYKGSILWSSLARLVAVMTGLALIASVVNPAIRSSTAAIQEELELMRKSLPVMLDEFTRFDRVFLQGEAIYYDYTIINTSEQGSIADNMERFSAVFDFVMTPQLKTSACTNSDTRFWLEEGRNLVHVYRDEQSNLLARITIGRSDCSVTTPPGNDS